MYACLSGDTEKQQGTNIKEVSKALPYSSPLQRGHNLSAFRRVPAPENGVVVSACDAGEEVVDGPPVVAVPVGHHLVCGCVCVGVCVCVCVCACV